MKLRDHPLVSCVGATGLRHGFGEVVARIARRNGEVGFLTDVILSNIDPPNTCFLVMQHMGAEYIGCLSFEDSAFCREIYRVLSGYCGSPIDEIGDIDISFALNGGSS